MKREDISAFVDVYIAYLRWDRLPEAVPTSKEEAKALTVQIDARARANPYVDAIDELFTLIHDQPSLAWEICLQILTRAEEPELGMFGAGDLETFVRLHAVTFADEVEREIRQNTALRKAFESLYIGSDVPAHVGRRFNQALRLSSVSEEHIIDWWADNQNEK